MNGHDFWNSRGYDRENVLLYVKTYLFIFWSANVIAIIFSPFKTQGLEIDRQKCEMFFIGVREGSANESAIRTGSLWNQA